MQADADRKLFSLTDDEVIRLRIDPDYKFWPIDHAGELFVRATTELEKVEAIDPPATLPGPQQRESVMQKAKAEQILHGILRVVGPHVDSSAYPVSQKFEEYLKNN